MQTEPAKSNALRSADRVEQVVIYSRSAAPSIDLLDEASLERAALLASARGDIRLVFDATGFLDNDRQATEKSWRQLDPEVQRPAQATVHVLGVVDRLTLEGNGGFFDWRSQPVYW